MDSGKKALFYDFINENMLSIVKGIIEIRNTLWKYKNRGMNQLEMELKQVPNWNWMKKNQYYLVTNLVEIFLINRFESETEFWYYEVIDYSKTVKLGTPRDENEIEAYVTKQKEIRVNIGSWKMRYTGSAERWVKGPIIPINKLKQSNFINWTINPLEE